MVLNATNLKRKDGLIDIQKLFPRFPMFPLSLSLSALKCSETLPRHSLLRPIFQLPRVPLHHIPYPAIQVITSVTKNPPVSFPVPRIPHYYPHKSISPFFASDQRIIKPPWWLAEILSFLSFLCFFFLVLIFTIWPRSRPRWQNASGNLPRDTAIPPSLRG